MAYRLRRFGSYTAGGRLVSVTGRPVREIAFTRDVRFAYDPNGTFAVEAAYVQYFEPEGARDAPPVILLHGGGMTGTMWEGTPDGRPGWLHHLLDRGFCVHVVDNVERGRAGWMPGLWEGEPLLRSLEEAWSLFRLGPPEGFTARRAFPGQRFPVVHLETFARGFVPRWTSTTDAQVAALSAVLERLGRASLVCHSQGGEIALRATAQAPARVAAVAAVEPSGLPPLPGPCPPVWLMHGDYLGVDALWRNLSARWQAWAVETPSVGIVDLAAAFPGTSHMPMMDHGSEDVAAVLAERLAGVG